MRSGPPRRGRGSPPRAWTRVLHAFADPERRDAQLGDLAEEHEVRAARGEDADRWYRRQAIRSIAPNLATRARRALSRYRDHSRGDGMMGTLFDDVRRTLRGFGRAPAFHGVVLLTLGLGIGAVSTTFSVVHGLVLSPFPFPEADRIVGVGSAYPRLGSELGFFENMSPAEFEDVRNATTTLEDVVAWDMGNRQIAGDGPPENVFTAFWWGDALTTLQMDAHLGRGFTADEVAAGDPVAMLGYGLWVSRFGADSTLIGSTLTIGETPFTLVGIVPEGVDVYGTDLWTLMPVGPERFTRDRRQFQMLGRITEGATLAQVNQELTAIASRVAEEHGAEFEEYEGWSLQALPWAEVSSRLYRTAAFVLLGAVTFVLLLVCANTANLLLARAQARRREMAVRTALGAGRSRLVAQVLTESVVLGVAGGTLGVALAALGVRAVRRFIATLGLNVAGTIELDGPVLAFAAVTAVASGILFGATPALQASGHGIAGTLQAEGKGATASSSRQRIQRALVGVQVALAFLLLAGGGLLVHSFARVSRVDPGFRQEGIQTMRITLPRDRYSGEAVPGFFRDVTTRLAALPGVSAAAAGTQYPGVAFSFERMFFDGVEADADGTLPTTMTTVVTPGYFETLGIPLVRGRVFTEADRADAPRVVVINETTASRFFAGRDPVGLRLKIGTADPAAPWWEIVGVVGSTTNLGLDARPFPEVFAPHAQVGDGPNQLFVLLRSEGAADDLVAAARGVVEEMDPNQAVYSITTAEERLRSGIAPMRATALFLTAFASFALILAAVGIYAVVSFTVTERAPEIGLRVALGADRGAVRRLVVRDALLPVLIGAAAGLAGAIALGGVLTQVLFEVEATDPLTLGSVALLLVGVAATASWIPAFRASRLDPVEALRTE